MVVNYLFDYQILKEVIKMPKPKSGWDFEGWASKNDLQCEDGLIIRKDAFKHNDGKKVPLVWNHVHDSPSVVLGHAILENRDQGVYAYCYLNNSQAGRDAKEAIQHGDIESLSIWANNVDRLGNDVNHGNIRELSLVVAGANPGACVESVFQHGMGMDLDDEEGLFYTGEPIILSHAAEDPKGKPDLNDEEELEDDETVGEVIETLTDKQKAAVAILIDQAVSDNSGDDDEEREGDDDEVRHNIFESQGKNDTTIISHAVAEKIFIDAKRLGSFKEAIKANIEDGTVDKNTIMHAGGYLSKDGMTTGMEIAKGTQQYGFNDVSMLLPDYKNLNVPPEFIKRDQTWVEKLMSKVHNTPLPRVRSTFADITEDEARAKGYIKGNQKKEEVFRTLKRATDPQTIYKKQKLDRDDIIDLNSEFDVVNWLKMEMKIMIAEEKARAMLIGDGRPSDSDDKIQEIHIRPVVTDVPLFNTIVKVTVSLNANEETIAKAIINAMIKNRKKFKGTGKPDLWTNDDYITDMLLLENAIGDKIYRSENELATTLRVGEIIPVEPMEGYEVTIGENKYPLIGTMVNFADYNVGRDPRFDKDQIMEGFDIDFNQHKYLMEDRFSGALVKPFSAVTFVLDKQ